ncbi:hypothetical protein [Terrabacter sp. NPDC000476]|uniref:hypothetical protein n=1 Tax=Terrabacter sp. NPDC000476 TaxID=3154258 RepID=UPI00331CA3D8
MRAALVGHAHGLLDRLATLLTPLPRDAVSDLVDDRLEVGRSQTTMNGLGRLVLTVVSAPAVVTLLAFERVASQEAQEREYAADLRAAEVAGTAAVVRLLLTTMGLAGVHTLAGAAARRREDPFTALEAVRARPDLTDRDVALARSRAREHDLRWDAAHPRDDLRLGVLEAHPATPEPEAQADRRALARAADAELTGQRTVLARRLRDELLDTWR